MKKYIKYFALSGWGEGRRLIIFHSKMGQAWTTLSLLVEDPFQSYRKRSEDNDFWSGGGDFSLKLLSLQNWINVSMSEQHRRNV